MPHGSGRGSGRELVLEARGEATVLIRRGCSLLSTRRDCIRKDFCAAKFVSWSLIRRAMAVLPMSGMTLLLPTSAGTTAGCAMGRSESELAEVENERMTGMGESEREQAEGR